MSPRGNSSPHNQTSDPVWDQQARAKGFLKERPQERLENGEPLEKNAIGSISLSAEDGTPEYVKSMPDEKIDPGFIKTNGDITEISDTESDLANTQSLQNASEWAKNQTLQEPQSGNPLQANLLNPDGATLSLQDKPINQEILPISGTRSAEVSSSDIVRNLHSVEITKQGPSTPSNPEGKFIQAEPRLAQEVSTTETDVKIDPQLAGRPNASSDVGGGIVALPENAATEPQAILRSEIFIADQNFGNLEQNLQSSELSDLHLARQGGAATETLSSQILVSKSDSLTLGLETTEIGLQISTASTVTGQGAGPTMLTTPTATTLGPNIVPIVSEAILLAKETSKGVTVQLDPPEMGRVYIDFIFDGDRHVSVIVKTETLDAQHLLRERTDDFLAMLKENGLDNTSLSFEFHDNQEFEEFDGALFSGSPSEGKTEEDIAEKAVLQNPPFNRLNTYSDGLDLRL